jgi:hypothetical protein
MFEIARKERSFTRDLFLSFCLKKLSNVSLEIRDQTVVRGDPPVKFYTR